MTGLSPQLTRPTSGRTRSRPMLVLALSLALAVSATVGYRNWDRSPLRGAPQCSCVTPPPPHEALAASAAVFDGTVAGIARDPAGRPFADLTVTFIVHTQWKGVVRSPVVLRTAADGALCGYAFRLGQRYIVYADGSAEDMQVGLCGRTRVHDAAEALELGPNEPPADAIPHPIWSIKPPLACPDCAPSLPPLEALAQADGVWHGQPLSIEDLGPGEGHDHRVVYRNLGWWKGDAAPTVAVRVPFHVIACDPWLWMVDRAPGLPSWREHLVFAMAAPEGGWELRLCGQTRFYDAAQAAQLGSPKATAVPTAMQTPISTSAATVTVEASATIAPNHTAVPTITGEPTVISTPTVASTPTMTETPPACPTLLCPGCPGPQPALSWLAQADAVFLGQVVGLRQVDCDHRVRFKVLERFKGAPGDEVEVFVGNLAWQCQRRYAVGDESVIFAARDEAGGLRLPFCFGIVSGDPLEELRQLGPPPDHLYLPLLRD